MRTTSLFFVLLALAAALPAATVTFVSPQPGAQVIGPTLLEVTTDAQSVDRVEFSVDGILVGVARTAPYRIFHDFGDAVGAHEIRARVLSNGFRDSTLATVRTVALTAGGSIDVDLVEVPLRARSNRTLTAADLRIRENGVEQTIREVQQRRGATHFVFVIDRSLSMGDGRLAEALAAVDAQRLLLHPDDQVSVVLFNHTVAEIRLVARDEKLADVFGRIVPSGGTSLRDAIASIPSRDRTCAIVITDGGDRNSELSEEAALRRISGTRTVVDAIVLGRRSRFLEKAASNTGGDVVEAARGEISAKLRDLILDINGRYLVVYQSHGTPRGWRSVEVTARRGGVTIVNARKGYFAR